MPHWVCHLLGGKVARPPRPIGIVLIAGKIRESFGERETPSRLHALGVQQLLAGRYDDAAASLLAAAREQPNNARYVSDVAAVQLERARLGLRPDDLPRALASADRARRLDPSLREAWFNRALAATALSLNGQAKQAWTEYLARDNSSPWATEARKRLEDLSKPTPAAAWAGIQGRLHGPIDAALADEAVRAQMTEARNFLEDELLPQWAAAVEAGRDASRELDGIRNMADAFARIAGDSLYRDAVAAIDRAGNGDSLRALARGHALYANAAGLFAEDRFADAAPGMASARAQLSAAGSPFAIRPTLELGAIGYVRGNYDDAIAAARSRALDRDRQRLRACQRPRHVVPRPDRIHSGTARRRSGQLRRYAVDVRADGRRRAGGGGPPAARIALFLSWRLRQRMAPSHSPRFKVCRSPAHPGSSMA